MSKPIAKLGVGAEFMALSDWREAIAHKTETQRFLKIWDPIRDVTFPGVNGLCVFGFTNFEDEAWRLVYLWSPMMLYQNSPIKIPAGHSKPDLKDWILFGAELCNIRENECDFGCPSDLLRSVPEEIKELFQHSDHVHLHVLKFEDIRFAAVYKSDRSNVKFQSEAIEKFLAFHFDYFKLKTPVWDSVPLSFLSRIASKRPDGLSNLLLGPKGFDPRRTSRAVGEFLWPWQRSIRHPDERGELSFRPIRTTSLVFDIRKSTMVMEQLAWREKGIFPAFIRELAELARIAVFKWGGFFDKETGDGIVAHFCDFDEFGDCGGTPSVRAFRAAQEILSVIAEPCNSIQSSLNMGVGGLGGSIGLHSSAAVWSCDNGRISALGDSVIMAARLCNEAENFSIFASNSEYFRIAQSLSVPERERFERREYSGKEWNSGAKLFGRIYRTQD